MTSQVDGSMSGTADGVPERFVPDEMRGELVEAEHLARYAWASAFCSGRRVLDAGCGVGYGAEMINEAGATEVVAVDISESAVDLARSAVTAGVVCEVGDVRSLAYEDDSFDVVVCFEVIEHLEEQERVLDELARVLAPDGLLLISSPNRERYVPGNPHHRHELGRAEMQAALDSRFASARIISQHVMLASIITWSASPRFEGADTLRTAEPKPDDEIYLLGMAGSELPPDPGPVVTLGRFAEARLWLEHIEHQRQHIERQAHRLEDLESREESRRAALEQLAEAQRRLAATVVERAELEAAVQELAAARERELAAREGEAALLEELGQLRQIASSRSWRLTAPLRKLAAEAKRRS
jgi:SAM-dependent methyltransferase